MFSRSASLLLTALLMAFPAIAQSQLLIDPSQAPITSKGAWQQKVGSADWHRIPATSR